MTGPDAEGFAAIATNRVDAVTSHALSGGLSASSTTAKSAASALSDSCTRTVAAAGSSVKLTWNWACQGSDVTCTDPAPIEMQGRAPGNSSPRANMAAATNGAAETKIFKRTMICRPLDQALRIRWGLMVGGA